MKKSLWFMMLCGLLLKAQAQGTLQQYYYMGQGRPAYMAPIAGYQTSRKLYFEGRYNYEALKAFSLYAGQTFTRDGKWSYSITPMGGIVLGSLNGGSLAANIEIGYKKFNFSLQPQYTFAFRDNSQNFIYSWSDLSYQLANWLAAGVSIQNTMQLKQPGFAEKGLFAEFSYKGWALPVYVFSPTSTERNFVAGIRFELPLKESKPEAISVPQGDIFLPHQLSSTILPPDKINELPGSQTTVPIAIAAASKDSKYFILTGSFKNRQEAIEAQAKFPEDTDAKAILYASGSEYKIRISGFDKHEQAQGYLARLLLPDLKNTCSILPYQSKNVVLTSINN